MATELELLSRITVRADIFGGKPIVRDQRIAVEHILGMLRRPSRQAAASFRKSIALRS